MRSFPLKAVLALLGIWLVVGGAIYWARNAKPTPASLAKYLADHPIQGKSWADRDREIHKVADQLNALDQDQRREVRGKYVDHFFRALTPEEQGRFLDLTLPTGFKQMMDALNKMTPEKRKEFVDRSLADMKKHEGEDAPANVDPNAQKIVQQGLRSFYSEASADVKMDLSPLIDQMQKNLQGVR